MWIDLLRGLVLAYKRWQQRRTTLFQLQSLDDRMLRDIGLHRMELSSVVEESLAGSTVPPWLRRRSRLNAHSDDALTPQCDRRPDLRSAA